MKRIIIQDSTPIPPFGEPASELRIMNKQLWLLQRDLLSRYSKGSLEVHSLDDVPTEFDTEVLVCKDNLFFNSELLDAFIQQARASGRASQIAFSLEDKAITTHALPLQKSIRRQGDVYVADMYYYPAGRREAPQPVVVDTQPFEMGYYNIPQYMAPQQGELVFQVPNRVFLSIEHWIHVYVASTPMGVFNWARQVDELMQGGRLANIRNWTNNDWNALRPKLKLLLTAFAERVNPFEDQWRNHFLACRELVKVGKNCSIDPTAVIHGPTVIGDNVYIGPGVVITNSLIGNNVNIMQGAQVMLSVVSDRCFLPFNSGLFMSSLMDGSMVAQNTTLQLCIVGRNTFIGACNTFTDFNLLGQPIRAFYDGEYHTVGMPVLGSGVGHNCKIGSGFYFYPGRMVGSNTVLILDNDINLVNRNINVPELEGKATPVVHSEADGMQDMPPPTVYRWPYLYNPDTGEMRDPRTAM
ncbi:MAG: multidrug transporter [Chloroflexaceae bacterium]|nr:multidrug transporter [Chloroflexaceae bacterium]